MMVPHLVLVAIEMVSIAMRNTVKTPESLAERINQAAIPGGFALAAVMATAGWISFDLRRASRGEPRSLPLGTGIAYRLGSFAAMLGMAWFLVKRTIPDVHVDLYRGFEGVIGGEEILVIGVGFAGLSAGIVARSIVRRASVDPLFSGPRDSPSWPVFLGGLAAGGDFHRRVAIAPRASRTFRACPCRAENLEELAVVLWNRVHHVTYPFSTNAHVLLLPGSDLGTRMCRFAFADRWHPTEMRL